MNYNKEYLSSPDIKPRLINEKEAARLLGLRPQTLANWRSLRRGPDYHRLVGSLRGRGAIRYQLESIIRWAEAGKIEPEGGAVIQPLRKQVRR